MLSRYREGSASPDTPIGTPDLWGRAQEVDLAGSAEAVLGDRAAAYLAPPPAKRPVQEWSPTRPGPVPAIGTCRPD